MLATKLALVTGAASGIGLAVAKTFANEGATVCMIDIQEETLKTEIENLKNNFENNYLNHSFYTCDVKVREQVINLYKDIQTKYNKIPTIIVNCAGVLCMKLFLNSTENDFDNLIDVNLKGTFNVSHLAAKLLVEKFNSDDFGSTETYASIINIASLSGKNAMDFVSLYASTKSGVDALTRSIARELGKYKIRCNSILPGAIFTPMVKKYKQTDDRKADFTSLGRFGEASEVAQVCLFLASNMSSYITGASIECSGGMHS